MEGSVGQPRLARERAGTRGDLLTTLLLVVLVAGTSLFLFLAPSASEVYLAIHVAAAVVWVGGGAALTLFALLTMRARDPHAEANLVVQMGKIAQRLFMPASLVTLASGIAVVEADDIGYGSFWIDFGLVVWALSFVLGAFLISPRAGRLERMIEERGVEDPLVARGLEQVLRLARLDITMLLLVVVAMTAQPSF